MEFKSLVNLSTFVWMLLFVVESLAQDCDIRIWYGNMIDDDVFKSDLDDEQEFLKHSIESLVRKHTDNGQSGILECKKLQLYNDMMAEQFGYIPVTVEIPEKNKDEIVQIDDQVKLTVNTNDKVTCNYSSDLTSKINDSHELNTSTSSKDVCQNPLYVWHYREFPSEIDINDMCKRDSPENSIMIQENDYFHTQCNRWLYDYYINNQVCLTINASKVLMLTPNNSTQSQASKGHNIYNELSEPLCDARYQCCNINDVNSNMTCWIILNEEAVYGYDTEHTGEIDENVQQYDTNISNDIMAIERNFVDSSMDTVRNRRHNKEFRLCIPDVCLCTDVFFKIQFKTDYGHLERSKRDSVDEHELDNTDAVALDEELMEEIHDEILNDIVLQNGNSQHDAENEDYNVNENIESATEVQTKDTDDPIDETEVTEDAINNAHEGLLGQYDVMNQEIDNNQKDIAEGSNTIANKDNLESEKIELNRGHGDSANENNIDAPDIEQRSLDSLEEFADSDEKHTLHKVSGKHNDEDTYISAAVQTKTVNTEYDRDLTQTDNIAPASRDVTRKRKPYHTESEANSAHSGIAESFNLQKIILENTNEYVKKVHNIELLVTKLESHVLRDSVAKENHTAHILKLENHILRLENELLRMNMNIGQLKKENSIEMKNGVNAISHETSELTQNQNKAIVQYQSMIDQLTSVVRNQTDIINELKNKNMYLNYQNIILHHTLTNQSKFMSSMIESIKDLSNQTIQNSQVLKELSSFVKELNKTASKSEENKAGIDLTTGNAIPKLDSYMFNYEEPIESGISTGESHSDQFTGEFHTTPDVWCPHANKENQEIEYLNCIPFSQHALTTFQNTLHKNMASVHESESIEMHKLDDYSREKHLDNGYKQSNEDSVYENPKTIEDKEYLSAAETGLLNKDIVHEDAYASPILLEEVDEKERDEAIEMTENVLNVKQQTENENIISESDNIENGMSHSHKIKDDDSDDLPIQQSQPDISENTVLRNDDNADNSQSLSEAKKEGTSVSGTSAPESDASIKTNDNNNHNKEQMGENTNDSDSPLEGNNNQVSQDFGLNKATVNDQIVDSVPHFQTPVSEESIVYNNDQDGHELTGKQRKPTNNDGEKVQVNGVNEKQDNIELDNYQVKEGTHTINESKQEPSNNRDGIQEPRRNVEEKQEATNSINEQQNTDNNDNAQEKTISNYEEHQVPEENEKLHDSNSGITNEKEETNNNDQNQEQVSNEKKKPEESANAIQKPQGTGVKWQKVPLYIDQVTAAEAKDCYHHYKRGNRNDGIYKLRPAGLDRQIEVFCDMRKGGWTVLQRRQDGTTNFFKGWNEYKKGFGGLYGEHWLGLEIIHHLTNQDYYELRVDLMDWDKNKKYAEYEQFLVDDEANNYRLHVDGYSGDAGDGMSKHNGSMFSTKDRDNDKVKKELGGSCAIRFQGAGWYYSCYMSNLNGMFYKGGTIPKKQFDGVTWKPWTGPNYSLKKVEMKIRPLSVRQGS